MDMCTTAAGGSAPFLMRFSEPIPQIGSELHRGVSTGTETATFIRQETLDADPGRVSYRCIPRRKD